MVSSVLTPRNMPLHPDVAMANLVALDKFMGVSRMSHKLLRALGPTLLGWGHVWPLEIHPYPTGVAMPSLVTTAQTIWASLGVPENLGTLDRNIEREIHQIN